MVRYEVWLRIQGPPAIQATEDKTSSESWELQERLTRWVSVRAEVEFGGGGGWRPGAGAGWLDKAVAGL